VRFRIREAGGYLLVQGDAQPMNGGVPANDATSWRLRAVIRHAKFRHGNIRDVARPISAFAFSTSSHLSSLLLHHLYYPPRPPAYHPNLQFLHGGLNPGGRAICGS